LRRAGEWLVNLQARAGLFLQVFAKMHAVLLRQTIM